MSGLPFALAYERVVLARRSPPIYARGGLARYERAKLPERFPGTGLPPPVDAVHHALRDPARGDDEAGQAGRERGGLFAKA